MKIVNLGAILANGRHGGNRNKEKKKLGEMSRFAFFKGYAKKVNHALYTSKLSRPPDRSTGLPASKSVCLDETKS